MRILKEQGTFVILAHTPEMEKLIERCGRVAYRSEDKITEGSANEFIKMIIGKGHESVLEHVSITVLFRDHSRGFTHELVRHRLCAFTQESTRYVDESEFDFVCPPDMTLGEGLEDRLDFFKKTYVHLLNQGMKPQDARQFLPIGITSDIVVTANVREWRHIFMMRCAKAAHWEIKRTMRNVLFAFELRWPVLFSDLFEKLEISRDMDD